MNLEKLNQFEKDLLLRWFFHYMPMGSQATTEPTGATRFEFMRQFPAIYNKAAETEIVRVVHLSSNTPA